MAIPRHDISRFARRMPGLLAAASLSAGGCISGRALEGYPGYPFVEFRVPAGPDSVFFSLQHALTSEGFDLDFTERASGLINTRPAERLGRQIFLSVVIGDPAEPEAEHGAAAGEASRVWIAGYESLPGGARRINPLREEAWADLLDIAGRLSRRLGGTTPERPDPPGADRADQGASVSREGIAD